MRNAETSREMSFSPAIRYTAGSAISAARSRQAGKDGAFLADTDRETSTASDRSPKPSAKINAASACAGKRQES